jgi:hypothetical protein
MSYWYLLYGTIPFVKRLYKVETYSALMLLEKWIQHQTIPIALKKKKKLIELETAS